MLNYMYSFTEKKEVGAMFDSLVKMIMQPIIAADQAGTNQELSITAYKRGSIVTSNRSAGCQERLRYVRLLDSVRPDKNFITEKFDWL
jgi:hypothetical protein